jgi:4-amino-4-deoxy-L-arabinose transferase-like glycosyltransferase
VSSPGKRETSDAGASGFPLPGGEPPESGAGTATRRISAIHEGLLLAALVCYAALVWIWGAGRLDVMSAMESSRALVARGMMRSGDYVIPRRGAELYLAKPPLFDWSVALTSRLSGKVTAASLRLPSALSAMALLLAMYFAARPALGWATAYGACAATATSPNILGSATAGRVDMMLALWVAVSLLSAFYMLESHRGAWLYALPCGAGLAAGLMTKGPVVLTFFVPTVLLYVGFRQGGPLATDWRRWSGYMALAALLIWLGQSASARAGAAGAIVWALPAAMLIYFSLRGSGRRMFGWSWAIALAVVVLLAAPWPLLAVERLKIGPLLAALRHESWTKRISDVGAANWQPVWFYVVAFPIATLPYSLFVPLAFIPPDRALASDRRRRLLLLAKCWLAGSIAFYTVASAAKDIRYLLPTVPALSLLAADVMVVGAAQRLLPWMNRYVRSLGAVAVYGFCLAPPLSALGWFAAGLGFSGWLIAIVLVSATGAALGVYLHRVRNAPWAGRLRSRREPQALRPARVPAIARRDPGRGHALPQRLRRSRGHVLSRRRALGTVVYSVGNPRQTVRVHGNQEPRLL